MWDENVGEEQLIESHEVICFAAKWLGRKRIEFYSTFHNDKQEMLEQAHRLLEEADAVLHWNGLKFDIPHLNREFLLAGMQPPAPFLQIDLMQVVKKQFRFASNRLVHVSTALGIGQKKDTGGFKLWKSCMAGDPASWDKMRSYNKQDVQLLEDAYDKLLPWIHNHPHRNLYQEGSGCPQCGGNSVQRRGQAHTRLSSYQRFQCMECGTWLRGSKRIKGTTIQRVAT